MSDLYLTAINGLISAYFPAVARNLLTENQRLDLMMSPGVSQGQDPSPVGKMDVAIQTEARPVQAAIRQGIVGCDGCVVACEGLLQTLAPQIKRVRFLTLIGDLTIALGGFTGLASAMIPTGSGGIPIGGAGGVLALIGLLLPKINHYLGMVGLTTQLPATDAYDKVSTLAREAGLTRRQLQFEFDARPTALTDEMRSTLEKAGQLCDEVADYIRRVNPHFTGGQLPIPPLED